MVRLIGGGHSGSSRDGHQVQVRLTLTALSAESSSVFECRVRGGSTSQCSSRECRGSEGTGFTVMKFLFMVIVMVVVRGHLDRICSKLNQVAV